MDRDEKITLGIIAFIDILVMAQVWRAGPRLVIEIGLLFGTLMVIGFVIARIARRKGVL